VKSSRTANRDPLAPNRQSRANAAAGRGETHTSALDGTPGQVAQRERLRALFGDAAQLIDVGADRLSSPASGARQGVSLGAAAAPGGVAQLMGVIRFANLDHSKTKYQSKADDIIHVLSNVPSVTAFLADKNVLIVLESTEGAVATVTVNGPQVLIQLDPWFFEQQSRGRILGMLAHEIGVHPLADSRLTAGERANERAAGAVPTGLGTDTIAHDEDNQQDHIFAAVAGQPRYAVYRDTAYEVASSMKLNQAGSHVTDQHITDAIMTYLADVAMILATSDHRGRLLANMGRAAEYFNRERTSWLTYLDGKPDQVALTELTPGEKRGKDVFSEISGMAGRFILSMFTGSTSAAKAKQPLGPGAVRAPITTNQSEVLGDHGLHLQPEGASNKFFPTLNRALGVAEWHTEGVTTVALPTRLPTETDANIGRLTQDIMAGYDGDVPERVLKIAALETGRKILVIGRDGRMTAYGDGAPVFLLQVSEPAPHYRFAV
jgi:hypothetical protein